MRVTLISNQLGGYDGVSRLASLWRSALIGAGTEILEIAGRFGPDYKGVSVRTQSPGLWREGEPFDFSGSALRTSDYVVVFNAMTLASTPSASMALAEALEASGVPTVLLHIDPPYENKNRTQNESFPLTPDWALNCSITEHSSAELLRRKGVESVVVYVPYDEVLNTPGDRDTTRRNLGIEAGDMLVLHPAGVYKRKRIDRAVSFMNEAAACGVNVKYWLTGGDKTDPNYDQVAGRVLEELKTPLLTNRVENPADMYAAADVVLMTSDWEGWGMPVIESAAAGKPCLAEHYPVLDEIESLGIVTHALTIDNLVKALEMDGTMRETVERNRELARKFSSGALITQIWETLHAAAAVRGSAVQMTST